MNTKKDKKVKDKKDGQEREEPVSTTEEKPGSKTTDDKSKDIKSDEPAASSDDGKSKTGTGDKPDKPEIKEIDQQKISEPTIEIITAKIEKTNTKLETAVSQVVVEGVFGPESIAPLPTTELTNGVRVIKGEIPSLFEFYNTMSEIFEETKFGSLQQVAGSFLIEQALKTFPVGALTIRYGQNTKNIFDLPNVTKPAPVDVISEVAVEGVLSPRQSYLNRLLARICSAIIAFQKLHNVILSTPSKLISNTHIINNNLADVLNMNPATNDKPHPIFLLFNTTNQWIVDEIRHLVNNHGQVLFGEINTQASRQKIKMIADWGLATDQFTAAILNLNVENLLNVAMTTEQITNLLNTIVDPNFTDITSTDPIDKRFITFPTPTQEQLRGIWLVQNVSTRVMKESIDYVVDTIRSQNRLTLHDVRTVIQGQDLPARQSDKAFENMFFKTVNKGTGDELAQLVVYDMYAGNIDIKLTMPQVSDSEGSIVTLAAALSWFIAFKGIAQQNICELGYIIMSCLHQIAGAQIWNDYIRHNGWYMRRNDNGNWVPLDLNKHMRTTRNCNEEIRPSVFCQPILPGVNNMNNVRRFYNLLEQIRDLANTQYFPIELNRKREAGVLPYSRDDYAARMSHRRITYGQYLNNHQGDAANRILQLSNVIQMARDLFRRQNNNNYQEASLDNWFATFIKLFNASAERSTALMNLTIAEMQEWIANSPFYPSELKPRTDGPFGFFNYPKVIGFRGRQNLPNRYHEASPTQLPRLEFTVDFGFGLKVILAGQGEIENTPTASETLQPVSSMGVNKTTVPRTILPHDYEKGLKLWNQITDYATKGVIGLTLIYWLTHPNDPNNPYRNIAIQISQTMKVSVWNNLVATILKLMNGESGSELLNMVHAGGVVDARSVSPVLVFIDKVNLNRELPNNHAEFGPNWFYQQFIVMSPHDLQILNIVNRLFVDENSILNKRTRGLIIARIFTENIQPVPTENELRRNYPDVIDFNDIQVEEIENNQGKSFIVRIPGKPDITNPYDDRLKGVMIRINYVVDIRNSKLREFIAMSVSAGLLGITLLNKEVEYEIIDVASKTRPIAQIIGYRDVLDYLTQPDELVAVLSLPDVTYANNVVRTEYQQTAYVQCVGLQYMNTNNLVTSALIDTVEPPDNHVPFEWNMWRLGDQGANMHDLYIDGVPKLMLEYPNFNNVIRTLTREATDVHPTFTITNINPITQAQRD